ncbi:hypothetical protein Dtox_3086 [Desulfofarcimen acetoxidans DSM 771]|uniref:Phage-shock protein n=1 Tax=Desulfofarcimen acetoxidans (strain ATCC 49208 / DSM 771 / KCTC 5769 / VKM B-1644 / 5575) TaxID=485916 RepID=C8W3Q2_DESAS|nr:hypothetical protein Dtox_3086 [Desulfofarcimen acetoxidans DSM 771]
MKLENKLQSLTDVLKKNLFFFEALTVAELTQYVRQIMLQDYEVKQVEEKVSHCLRQNPCFYAGSDGLWRLNLQGLPQNDQFYSFLLKRQKPMGLRDFVKHNLGKQKKTKKQLIGEETVLIHDGRFIQWNNGSWSLTELEVESASYSLKQLVIKAMKLNSCGLSEQQLFDVVQCWREVTLPAVRGVLNKYPYFEQLAEGLWCYNAQCHMLYEEFTKKSLLLLGKQRIKWRRDRDRWFKKVELLENQLEEVFAANKQVAAALAEQKEIVEQHENLVTQMAEKDLLLSLRKKELFSYREHISKTDTKANSILHQCRLWVKRSRESEQEIQRLRDSLEKNQSSQASLFVKLQQYKEKDRENKQKLAEIQDKHSSRVAELQTEIVELKQKLEKQKELSLQDEKHLMEQINRLTGDLRDAFLAGEDMQKSMLLLKQELKKYEARCAQLERGLAHPLVKFIAWVCGVSRRIPREIM